MEEKTVPLWKEAAVILLALAILGGVAMVLVNVVLGNFSSAMGYATGSVLAMFLGAGFVLLGPTNR